MLIKLNPTEFNKYARQLVTLVIPILITQFCQSGLGVVDAIMAGKISTLDLAAVAVGSGVWLPVSLLVMGTCMATMPLVGEALGQEKYNRIVHITQQSLWAASVLGIVGMVAISIIPNFFDVMKVPAHIQPLTREYLFYVSFGLPAVTAYTVLRSYIEAFGLVVPVAIIGVIGFLLNIPLNYIFLHGHFGMPALGGAGCGIASACVLWVSLILLVIYLIYTKHSGVVKSKFYRNFSLPDMVQIKKFLLLGIPIGIAIFFETSLFSLAALVISPLGELAVASHQIALSITSQIFMIPWSVSLALSIMVASKYGEKDLMVLRQVQTTGLICAICLALLSSLTIYVFRPEMTSFFTDDVPVQALAMSLLLYAVAYQIFDALQINIAGILRGMQDTKTAMCITFFCYWLVALPLGAYLVRYTYMGVKGFWLALVIGLCMSSCLLSIRLFQQKKRLEVEFEKVT